MVILYTTGCPMCSMLKSKLEDSGINFEINTDKEKMKELGFTKVPMLDVDGHIMDLKEALRWVGV